jgi:hypothetical protein
MDGVSDDLVLKSPEYEYVRPVRCGGKSELIN